LSRCGGGGSSIEAVSLICQPTAGGPYHGLPKLVRSQLAVERFLRISAARALACNCQGSRFCSRAEELVLWKSVEEPCRKNISLGSKILSAARACFGSKMTSIGSSVSALSAALAAFSRGRFEPATTRCPKMLSEEEFHASLGAAWYRRLAASSSEARTLLREATDRFLPPTLAWLAASDGPARALVEAGVTDDGAAVLTEFKNAVRDVLAAGGVDVDQVKPDLEGWDGARGRGPGRPAEETVERARGDRNRALFVE